MSIRIHKLWFAEKFVSLLIEQHQGHFPKQRDSRCDLLKNSYLCLLNNTQRPCMNMYPRVVICWKIRIFAYWTTPRSAGTGNTPELWFAEKFVSLLIEQHPYTSVTVSISSCDLLKNSYLCLLNNTSEVKRASARCVVICWKIRIFAYWTTPRDKIVSRFVLLWFAEKFVSLLIEQHLTSSWV